MNIIFSRSERLQEAAEHDAVAPIEYTVSDSHYPNCPHITEAGECAWCDDETIHIRQDFAAARYELERGN